MSLIKADQNLLCMETKKLSVARINRLKAQGYLKETDREICDLAFGHRFALITCTSFVGIGVATASVPILTAMAIVAFGGIILPNHPFDYIYNFILRGFLHKPKQPPRSKQLKFACTIATSGLAITAWLFYAGYTTAGYIVGGALFLVAFTVSTSDLCIPSMIYNFLFGVKVSKSKG